MFNKFTREEKKHFKKMSVVVISPIGDYTVHNGFLKSVANMIAYSWMQGLKVYVYGFTERTVVDWARNSLARYVRDQTCEYTNAHYTHALWLDCDHVFNPDMLCQLARHDKDAVSALYFARGAKNNPVAFVKPDQKPEDIDLDDIDSYKHAQLFDVPPVCFKVEATGFGGILTKREMFVDVPEPWFTLDWRAGEDIAFCTKARKYGFEFWLDGQYTMGHIDAPNVVSKEDWDRYMAEHPEEFEEMVSMPI